MNARVRSLVILSMCCIGVSLPIRLAIAQTEEIEQFADSPGLLAATPQANSVRPSDVRLPGNTQDYFRRIFPLYLSAPLPSKIYNQGGIPRYVAALEIDNNPSGALGSYQPGGRTKTSENAFFQALGTNGRACVTCHQPPSGMSVSVRNIKARLNATGGRDPIFAPVDGANCPNLVKASDTSGSLYRGRRGKGTKDFRNVPLAADREGAHQDLPAGQEHTEWR